MLEHIDDLERVLPLELFLTDASEIRDGGLRARAAPRDVQLQDVSVQVAPREPKRKLT